MEMINHSFDTKNLARENQHFSGTGGVSQNNRSVGFVPAFLDSVSGQVYRSCFADGTPAPIHVLDGLPEHAVIKRDPRGAVLAVRCSIISGFERAGHFYTRQEAVDYIARH